MSDNVLIILVVAATIVVILFMIRKRLHSFVFKALGFEGKVETHKELSPPPAGVRISGNYMKGANEIDVQHGGTGVEGNELRGENKIRVGSGQDRQ